MDAKLNQSDLISLLAKGRNISVAKAELFTKNFFDLIIEGLEQDGIVKINGLGTFKITDVASRGSVNVNTGEKIEIKGHNKLTFIPADALKDEVNQPFAMFEPVEVDDIYQPDSTNETETDEVVETLAVIPAETEMSAVEEKDVEETEKVQVEEEPVAEAAVSETSTPEIATNVEERASNIETVSTVAENTTAQAAVQNVTGNADTQENVPNSADTAQAATEKATPAPAVKTNTENVFGVEIVTPVAEPVPTFASVTVPNKPYEEMTVEELQAAVLERLSTNGPLTERMKKEVFENIYHNSLVNWIKSFR